ncbi:hypothetical protein VitviT2T_020423 [Vitis vinifera]|uniref:Ubiquitin-like protease family profile domain-containing protein n=1 Tax=Vitis vinifera TaxID=29760 RepID=A0ABY9D3V8_VITVI|nr:hypothetical protein VitviT2T_020423 [Vitis vinifera]
MDIPYVNVNEVFLLVLIKNHWTLYVYDLSNKRIQLLDSRPGMKKTTLSGIQQNLAKVVLWLAAHKKEVSPYDLRTFNFLTPDVPLQPNEHDCGVFVMKFMELWSMGGFSKSIDVGKLKHYRLKIMGRGQTKTLMFVHINLEPDAVGETINTVKFAERFATVKLGAARVNKDSADVKELKEQIATLKAALARKEGEPEDMQHSFSNSSERYRTKASDLSHFHCKKQAGDMLDDQNSCRQPMWDVGNIEVNIFFNHDEIFLFLNPNH